LAATSEGLYISTDAGNTWTKRMSGNFTAVAADPSDPASFLAAETTGLDHTNCGATIWRGRFLTAGAALTKTLQIISSPGPFAANVALASSPSQSFALASGCSGHFLASLVDEQNGHSGMYGWHAFAKGAFTAAPVNGLFGAGGVFGTVGQGEFDNVITVVPGSSCDVIVGGVGLYRVTTRATPTGDCTGEIVRATELSQTMHEDMHALAFSNGTLLVGNDGGLWSTPSLTAPLWTTPHEHLRPDQSISTFYAGEALDSTHLIGGLQDEGTVSTLASGSTSGWSQVGVGSAATSGRSASAGGDGGYSYAWGGVPKYYEQVVGVQTEVGSGNFQSRGACGLNPNSFPRKCSGDNAQFPDPPLLLDTLEGNQNKLLEVTDKAYLTEQGGGNWPNISPGGGMPPLILAPVQIEELGFTCGSDCPDYVGAAVADWKANHGPDFLTASAFGAVRWTTAPGFLGSRFWTDIGADLPQPSPATKIPGLPWISGVAINPCIWSKLNSCGQNHEAWVSIQENGLGQVYHTNDYTYASGPVWGKVFQSGAPVTSLAVASTPNGDNNHVDVYIGLANGGVDTCGECYGASPHPRWLPVGSGLPRAWVSDVSCSTDGKNLVAWTYGRGAWQEPLPTFTTGCVSLQQSDSFG
jgi:hypothetical protein